MKNANFPLRELPFSELLFKTSPLESGLSHSEAYPIDF
jgi:hypothetical protein